MKAREEAALGSPGGVAVEVKFGADGGREKTRDGGRRDGRQNRRRVGSGQLAQRGWLRVNADDDADDDVEFGLGAGGLQPGDGVEQERRQLQKK